MTTWTDLPCVLNGQETTLGCAQVSVMDRGFLFGDGVYDVVPVYARRPFRLEAHLARLARSLAAARLNDPLGRAGWAALLHGLVARLPDHADQCLYVQVTRGVAMRQHAMPIDVPPTVFAYAMPFPTVPSEVRHRGVSCVTARDFRWERGDIKSISMLGNVLARQMSVDQGAYETIMVREGYLTEASSSNVWIVQDGALIGPPASHHLLEGVRVELLAELCEELHLGFNRRPIPERELATADEVLLSSATKEVLAVTTLDGEPVGHGALRGKPGPVYARLYEAYQQHKRQPLL
ncbi:aminotransferase class IV [Roseateles sp. BYS180W]|uniref:Aminotransferase class IV n=1 Tax=Roseateles rivi TaxID=3299028 RepID=A0ABW7FUP6_9BURK